MLYIVLFFLLPSDKKLKESLVKSKHQEVKWWDRSP